MKIKFFVKAAVTSVITIAGLTLPIFPSTWAKPSAVKIMSQEIQHNMETDFKGNLQNVLLQSDGKNVKLKANEEEKPAVYTSQVIKTNISFTDVGAHWISPSQLTDKEQIQVEIRTSTDNKTWDDWIEAHTDHLNGPENQKNTRTYTDLLLGQRGEFIQYRITMQTEHKVKPELKDFTLTLINSEDGERVEHKGGQKKVSLASLLYNQAEAAINKPSIVSRSQWGADESLRYKSDGTESWPRVYSTPITHMVVHHSDTPNDDPDPAARVRSIYYYHTVTRGWGDIGYNAIIGSDGQIYEGRKGKDNEVLTNGVISAHAYSYNHHSFGAMALGNYNWKNMPDNTRNSLVDLLTYVANLNGIDPKTTKDYVRDYSYNDPNVPKVDLNVPTLTGHGLLPRHSTDCPGEFNKEDLENLKNLVANQLAKNPVIVDNDASGNNKVGSWALGSSATQKYGQDYEYSSKGTGSSTFSWNFNLPVTGNYHVYVWYSQGTNRATNAPYTVHTKTGAVTKAVNQQQGGGAWVDLGVFNLNSGANKVTLSNNADNLVIADAIKVEHVPVPDNKITGVVVDDSSSAYISATPSLSDWPTSSNVVGGFNGGYRPHAPKKGATFTWKPLIPESGNYQVYVRYTTGTDRATNSPYTIRYDGGSVTKLVNQKEKGNQWISLGTYPFKQGMDSSIVLSDQADGYVIADAVKLIKRP